MVSIPSVNIRQADAGAVAPTDQCQLEATIAWLLTPPNDHKQMRWQQTAVAGSGFGTGGQNLSVKDGSGNAKTFQVKPLPENIRTLTYRNLSTSTTVLYWYTDAKSPPANAYETLPASAVVSEDVWNIEALTFMPDPTATDAGFEIKIGFYNPKKAL